MAAVRENVALLDAVNTYHEAFAEDEVSFKPLQLPFNKNAHWVALEFPEVSSGAVGRSEFVCAAGRLFVCRAAVA